MTKLSELKARKTLMSVGLDASKFELACIVTNEVWLTETHAVRFNKAGDGRLRREAFLARHLPHELGYPPIVAYGGEVGADYLILERLPGRPLAHCWPSMSDGTRQNAVTQLAHQLQLLHSTRTPAIHAKRPQRDPPNRTANKPRARAGHHFGDSNSKRLLRSDAKRFST